MERNGGFQFPSLKLAILKVDLPVSSQAAIGHAEGGLPKLQIYEQDKGLYLF